MYHAHIKKASPPESVGEFSSVPWGRRLPQRMGLTGAVTACCSVLEGELFWTTVVRTFCGVEPFLRAREDVLRQAHGTWTPGESRWAK
jgi:hypothetical protein